MNASKATILAALCLTPWLLLGSFNCADGTLQIQNGADGPDNTNNGNNNGNNNGPTPDVGPDANENNGNDCCTPEELECVSDDEYRECDPIGEFCGNWVGPLDCPIDHVCNPDSEMGHPCEPLCTENHPEYGSPCSVGVGVCQREGELTECDGDDLVCDAQPGDPEPQACDGQDNNCDGEIDSEGICETCVDDEFGPDNHSYNGAADLEVGTTLENLVLCDNNAPVDSQNWFYLDETATIDVELNWEQTDAALGFSVQTGSFPSEHADTGIGDTQVSYQETLEESDHVYIKVYSDMAELPVTGIDYSISRLN